MIVPSSKANFAGHLTNREKLHASRTHPVLRLSKKVFCRGTLSPRALFSPGLLSREAAIQAADDFVRMKASFLRVVWENSRCNQTKLPAVCIGSPGLRAFSLAVSFFSWV